LGIIYTKSLTWKSYTRLHSTNDSINDLIEIALEHIILNQDLDGELKKLIPKQNVIIFAPIADEKNK
jgi:Trm5-related predicted tRNA methylase